MDATDNYKDICGIFLMWHTPIQNQSVLWNITKDKVWSPWKLWMNNCRQWCPENTWDAANTYVQMKSRINDGELAKIEFS